MESAANPRVGARRLGAAAIVLGGFCLLGALYAVAMQGRSPGKEGDFIGYWAGGQQLLHHRNPFDPEVLQRLEVSAGYDRVAPSITPSPPATYLLLLPLGLADAQTMLVAWGMAMMAALALAIWLLWDLHGRPDTLLHLCGFLFAPAWVCILGGQIGIFLLLGVALFLYFVERRPFVAGLLLLPCMMKPQLFLPVGVALIVWAVARRGYAVIAGALAGLAVSTAVTLWFDPHVWAEYGQMLAASDVRLRYTPNFSVLLREAIDPNAAWLQYVLAGLACIWAAWFAWRRRARWDWMHEGLLVLLVSRICAPYAWFTDESILLPAALTGLWRAKQTGRAVWPFAVVAGGALAEVMATVDIKGPAYLWTGPAWLACYLYATMSRGAEAPHAAAEGLR